MEDFQKLIQEICDELQIQMSILSKDWVLMLEKDHQTRFISGYKFDVNGHALGSIMDDKYAMYEVLKKKNIPVIEHTIMFRSNNHNTYAKGNNELEKIYDFWRTHDKKIVLKGNGSTCGREVFKVTTEEELETVATQLFRSNFSISICPFYEIKTEYRLIYVQNECVLCYGKKRPIVIGDGKRTIRELLEEFNPFYYQNKKLDASYDRILPEKEVYEDSWKFNLSEGSIPIEVENTRVKEDLLKLGNNISREIDLQFCSVDIIETMDGKYYVMELNSGVMMLHYSHLAPSGKEKAKEVYRKAILSLFHQKKS